MASRNINKSVQLKKQYIYMLEDTTNYCLDPLNIGTTKLVPDFEAGMVIVNTKVNSIIAGLGPRLIMTKGWADQKEYYRKALVQNIFAVSSPVAGYANANSKFDLAKQMSRSVSAYLKLKPNELASFASTMVTVITPMLSSIIKTGVTLASLDAITTSRAALVPYINKPTTSKEDLKSDTERLVRLLTEAINITYFQLDKFAVQFKQMGKLDYYTNYINRRKLKNYGVKHAHASVNVFMGDTNSPIKGAVVTVNGTKLKAVNTNANGHCSASPVPPGMHTITVKAPGFPNPVTSAPQEFIKGKPTYFTINITDFQLPQAPETVSTGSAQNA